MISEEAKIQAFNSSRENSTLLSNISRELYTPLSTIHGFAELLGNDPSIGPKQQEHIQRIISSSEHVLALLHESTNLCQIEAGLLPVNETACNLYGFLEAIERMFNQQAINQDLSLLVFWDENVPEFVSVDEESLSQIVVNLVGSVFDFTELGGITLHVSTRSPLSNKEPLPAESGQGVTLSVSVSGTSEQISQPDMNLIFNPFWQSKVGQKTVHSGLGLAVAKGLVEQMGGKIDAESQEEKGIIFRFSIPAKISGRIGEDPLPHVATYNAPSLNSAALAGLPEKLVDAMREELKKGNMLRLRELIIQVSKIDRQLAMSITELAKQYDYEKLNVLFKK